MKACSSIRTIFKREFTSYFVSPVAYVFLFIFLVLTSFFTFAEFLGDFYNRDQATLDPFFIWHPWLYLVLVPAVGMGLWSEERRSGTLELLLSMPINTWHAIVGKFLAAWAVLTLALALTFPMILTVCHLGDPDLGVIAIGYLGSFLIAGTYLAVTTMISAMTRNQVIAFVSAVVVSLFLLLCGFPPVTGFMRSWAPGAVIDAVASMSVMVHYDSLRRGVVDVRDLVYFASVIGFCLFLNTVVIRNRRST